MLVVVNQPHTEGFRIEGNIPKDVLDYIEKKYSKKDVSVMDDEGDELIDPFEQDFFKDFKSRETPGGNLRFYRKLVGMTETREPSARRPRRSSQRFSMYLLQGSSSLNIRSHAMRLALKGSS